MTTVTAAELAEWLDVTPRRISQLVAEGVLDRERRGQYQVKESVTAYCRFLRGQGDGENGVASLSVERAALAKSPRARIDLQTAELRRELLPADMAIRVLQALATAMKSRLQNLPAVLRQRHPELSHPVMAELDNLIRDALTQVATTGLPKEYRVGATGNGNDDAADAA